MCEEGLRLLKGNDYAGAACVLEAAAQRGDACAQNAFGIMHDGMFGLQQDWEAYVRWISRAAEQGYSPAFYNLGFVHEAGLGCEVSIPIAISWYLKGARRGHIASTRRRTDLYWQYDQYGKLYALRALGWHRRLARRGDRTSQCVLGMRYEAGYVVPRCLHKAIAWYRLAAEQGENRAKAWLPPLEEAWRKAAAEVKPARLAASSGDAHAQLVLGRAYLNGAGIRQDFVKALRWLFAAFEGGEAEAAYWIGKLAEAPFMAGLVPGDAKTWIARASEGGCLMATQELYKNLRNVTFNNRERLRLLRLAAEQGDAWAANELREVEEYGLPENVKWARIQTAAENGDPQAMMQLFYRYKDIQPRSIQWCLLQKDLKHPVDIAALGRMWLLRAVECGSGWAKESLEYTFSYGQYGFEQSQEKAALVHLDVAEQYYREWDGRLDSESNDCADVIFEMAERYLVGCGVAQSDERALFWYRRAAEMGSGDAYWRIGQFHEAGRGGAEPSYEMALKNYHHALGALEFVMITLPDSIFEEEEKEPRYKYPTVTDDPVATAWYRAAADAGDSDAQWLIGIRLKNGLGCEQDVTAAADYIRRSAAQRNVVGMTFLGLMYRAGVGVPHSVYLANKVLLEAETLLPFSGCDTFPGAMQERVFLYDGPGAVRADFPDAAVKSGESRRFLPDEE